ncbi:MAG: HEAT repeat domain-containing protein [Candidatus Zixiibacteriota bacterium]
MDEHNKPNNDPSGEFSYISRLLVDLLKTIKVVAVYPENNPIPTRLKESFIERFTDLIREKKRLAFQIDSAKIYYKGEVVYEDDSSDDSLAAIFFNAGITDISFNECFDYDEAAAFFRVMKAYVNKEPGAEDLVALLWQSEIDGLKYSTIEDVAMKEYEGEFLVQESCVDADSFIRRTSDDDSGRVQYSAIFLDDDEEEDGDYEIANSADAHDADNFAMAAGLPLDIPIPAGFIPTRKSSSAGNTAGKAGGPGATPLPDTTLILNEAFTLEKEELSRVEEMIRENDKFDIFDETITLLQEILFQETQFQDFSEVVMLTEKIQSEFIKQGNLNAAGKIIECLSDGAKRIKKNDPRFEERVHNALVMSGGWEKLSALANILNADSTISGEDLVTYLNHFGWESLSTITDLLGVLEHRNHREAICDYLVRKGRDHVDIISKGIFDRRWFVVRNTAAILSEIGTEETAPYLDKALNHPDARIRYQVALGLCRKPTDENINLLFKLIWDNDERVRQTALETILGLPDETRFQTIVNIINDDRFATLSETIQERIIILLSILGGEHAVGYLTSLITKGGWFRSQIKDFYQKVAFKALSRNTSDRAEKILIRFNKSWRRRLRRMAGEALRARRELKYSGDK